MQTVQLTDSNLHSVARRLMLVFVMSLVAGVSLAAINGYSAPEQAYAATTKVKADGWYWTELTPLGGKAKKEWGGWISQVRVKKTYIAANGGVRRVGSLKSALKGGGKKLSWKKRKFKIAKNCAFSVDLNGSYKTVSKKKFNKYCKRGSMGNRYAYVYVHMKGGKAREAKFTIAVAA